MKEVSTDTSCGTLHFRWSIDRPGKIAVGNVDTNGFYVSGASRISVTDARKLAYCLLAMTEGKDETQ